MRFLKLLPLLILAACSGGDAGLTDIHRAIVSDLPAVSHITADELDLNISDLLLLDIREPDEYAVSRLPGAVWVSPDISSESALIQIGDVSGKQVVVYCSVGRRSSEFADRLQGDLRARGAVKVSNLENGIFGWHNETRDLVDAEGQTDLVHPYNEIWKRYVSRQEKARYTPE